MGKRGCKPRVVGERFWQFVSPEPNSGCWLWTGALQRGYPALHAGGGKNIRASHVSLILAGRPRPSSGFLACHTCDVPICVNAAHLFWGTSKDNAQDAKIKGRVKTPIAEGEANGFARLTAAAAIEIVRSNRPWRDLAAEYGVSVAAINAIRSGRNWRPAIERAGGLRYLKGLGPSNA